MSSSVDFERLLPGREKSSSDLGGYTLSGEVQCYAAHQWFSSLGHGHNIEYLVSASFAWICLWRNTCELEALAIAAIQTGCRTSVFRSPQEFHIYDPNRIIRATSDLLIMVLDES